MTNGRRALLRALAASAALIVAAATAGIFAGAASSNPPGGQGCTPGYWKNHLDEWAAPGYSPDRKLKTIFGSELLGDVGQDTMLDALSYKGGPTLVDAQKILLRHAVAGILNRHHPELSYALSIPFIVDGTTAALDTNDRDAILAHKDAIEAQNELGCPLN
jgi:hypothetical protein